MSKLFLLNSCLWLMIGVLSLAISPSVAYFAITIAGISYSCWFVPKVILWQRRHKQMTQYFIEGFMRGE